MYGNNIVNFQESKIILNACTKKSGNLLKAPRILGYSDLLSRPSMEMNAIREPIIRKVRKKTIIKKVRKKLEYELR